MAYQKLIKRALEEATAVQLLEVCDFIERSSLDESDNEKAVKALNNSNFKSKLLLETLEILGYWRLIKMLH